MKEFNRNDISQRLILEYFKLESEKDLSTVTNRYKEYEDYVDVEDLSIEFMNSDFVKYNPLIISTNLLVKDVQSIAKQSYNIFVSRNSVIKAIDKLSDSPNSVIFRTRVSELDLKNSDKTLFNLGKAYNKFKRTGINETVVVLCMRKPESIIEETSEYKEIHGLIDELNKKVYSLTNIDVYNPQVDLSSEQLNSIFELNNCILNAKKALLELKTKD